MDGERRRGEGRRRVSFDSLLMTGFFFCCVLVFFYVDFSFLSFLHLFFFSFLSMDFFFFLDKAANTGQARQEKEKGGSDERLDKIPISASGCFYQKARQGPELVGPRKWQVILLFSFIIATSLP